MIGFFSFPGDSVSDSDSGGHPQRGGGVSAFKFLTLYVCDGSKCNLHECLLSRTKMAKIVDVVYVNNFM